MAHNAQEKRANSLLEIVRQNKRQKIARNNCFPKKNEVNQGACIVPNNFVFKSHIERLKINSSGLYVHSNSQNISTSTVRYYINNNYITPYHGWMFYFFDEVYEENSVTVERIEVCRDFFERNKFLFAFYTDSIEVDIKLLCKDKLFQERWSSFCIELKCYPQRTIKYLELALHQTIANNKDNSQCSENILTTCPMIRVKLNNYEPILPFSGLDYNINGNMVSISGCVTQVSIHRIALESQVIVCKKCNIELLVIHSSGSNFGGRVPKGPICNICGKQEYRRLLSSPYARSAFTQTIRLHEEISCSVMQRTIRVELGEELINCCLPGDVATVTGIYKASASFMSNEQISAINVTKKSIDYDAKRIEYIKNMPNLLKVLVQSLCPDLSGQDMIKLGLLLGLFNGSENSDRINILIVTDVCCNTAELLQSCSRVAHKGIYINGNQYSSASLESTIKKRENGINSSVMAGPFSIAADGCCYINDLQTISNYFQVLTNIMRRDDEDIVDSTLECNIPVKPSIFASIKPVGGYNDSIGIDKNIHCHKTFVLNFDLIFVMSNEPDEEHDKLIIDHKIKSLSNGFGSTTGSSELFTKDFPLNKQISNECIEPISDSLLKMYVSYARQYIKPELTENTKKILAEYLSKSEYDFKDADNLLSTFIKLTQARAKIELRKVATESDAQDVLNIYEYSQFSRSRAMCTKRVMYDNTNGKITKNKVNSFINALKNKVMEFNKDIISYGELKNIAAENHIADFMSLVSKLNEEGFLLKCAPKAYRVVTNYM